jgi:hypothetical protein
MTKLATLHTDLCHFTGTEAYHRISPFSRHVCTDGVNFLRLHGDCFWLPEAIASHLPTPEQCLRKYGEKFAYFHIWTLTPKDGGAILEARADTHDRVLIRQKIEYTDFPFDNGEPFKLYVAPQQVGNRVVYVVMLPSEN